MLMFIDEAKITVKAGDGGAGAISFRREKFAAMGGPNGGDGGKGGSLIFRAERSESTLLRFRYARKHFADDGDNGGSNEKTGRSGEDMVIKVPCGTIVKDMETDEVLIDLVDDGEEFLLEDGGMGGKGNTFFKSSIRQAPKFAQPGIGRESHSIKLELKLLADVGLVGLPNAGKSTLISRLTAAKPKVADYPFTTLQPNIGVVQADEDSFVIADMPGLIEGAHDGKGLGTRFLKHIERTAVICQLVDGSSGDAKLIAKEVQTIQQELRLYDEELVKRQRILLITKIDTLADDGTVEEIEQELKRAESSADDIHILPISSVAGKNLDKLVRLLHKYVKESKIERQRLREEELERRELIE